MRSLQQHRAQRAPSGWCSSPTRHTDRALLAMGCNAIALALFFVPALGGTARGEATLALARSTRTVSGDLAAARQKFLQGVKARDENLMLDGIEELSVFDDEEVAQLLVRHGLQNDSFLVHREAFEVLARLRSVAARRVVLELADKAKRWELRAHAATLLGGYGGEASFRQVLELLGDKKWQVRSAAIRACARFRRTECIEVLIARMAKERGRLLGDLAWALGQLTGETFEGVHEDWKNWWFVRKDGFVVPPLSEVRRRLRAKGSGASDLQTAVREGLYGPIYSEKIAFCLDVSGSMSVGTDAQGTRVEIAVRELQRVLENLSPDTYFNVIAFQEVVTPLFGKLQKAKPSALKKAIKKLEKLRAAGETNAYGALEAAFSDPDVDTIYLLSDGSPTVGDKVIPELIRLQVQEWNLNRRVIVNCIGFFPGDAKNQDKMEAADFLRSLAHENEGFYKEIY